MRDRRRTGTSSAAADSNSDGQRICAEGKRVLPAGFSPADVVTAVASRLAFINQRTREALETRREIGAILIQARSNEKIARHGWEGWVRTHLPFGRSEASEHVQLATRWDAVIAAVEADRAATMEREEPWTHPGMRTALALLKGRERPGDVSQTSTIATAAKKRADIEAASRQELKRLVQAREMDIHNLEAKVKALTRELEDLRSWNAIAESNADLIADYDAIAAVESTSRERMMVAALRTWAAQYWDGTGRKQ